MNWARLMLSWFVASAICGQASEREDIDAIEHIVLLVAFMALTYYLWGYACQ